MRTTGVLKFRLLVALLISAMLSLPKMIYADSTSTMTPTYVCTTGFVLQAASNVVLISALIASEASNYGQPGNRGRITENLAYSEVSLPVVFAVMDTICLLTLSQEAKRKLQDYGIAAAILTGLSLIPLIHGVYYATHSEFIIKSNNSVFSSGLRLSDKSGVPQLRPGLGTDGSFYLGASWNFR